MWKRKRIDPQKGRRYGYAAAAALMAVCCAGCAGRIPDNNNLIITEKEPEATQQYNLVTASIGDVVLTERIKCTYEQAESQDIYFSISGRRINKTLVKVGDSVVKGQLLAELVDDQNDERIEELEYQIERNSLLLEDSELNENYEISAKWLQFLYRSGLSDDEEDALKDSISRLQQDYEYLREDYQDAIDLDKKELESLQKERAMGRVYAKMNGTVSWMKEDLEGSTSTKDEVIIKIIDNSSCFFVVEGAEYADLFEEGVPVEMRISSGTSVGWYELLPYKMGEWGEKLTFSVAENYDSDVISVGTNGTISVIVDRRENVLTLPESAIHEADGKYYVYVVGEGDLREIRWIETGLYGNDTVEIKEGLEQGEKVIVR